MNREIPEYLKDEWQTVKDEYKVKTTTYITITKFEYEKLQQENQNLKEEVIALRKGLSKTRIRRDKYKRRYLKEKWKNKQLKETNETLMKCLKIDKDKIDFNVCYAEHLEKVLDEIREQLKFERKIALSLNKPYTVSVIDKLLDKVNK